MTWDSSKQVIHEENPSSGMCKLCTMNTMWGKITLEILGTMYSLIV